MSTSALICEFIPCSAPLPSHGEISAVFLIAFTPDGKIVACRNERGWDIPGGHLEGDETILEALIREIREEAGIGFEQASLLARLTPRESVKSMLVFATNHVIVGEFYPSEDALERAFFLPAELVERYHGNRRLLKSLIDEAVKRLKEDA